MSANHRKLAAAIAIAALLAGLLFWVLRDGSGGTSAAGRDQRAGTTDSTGDGPSDRNATHFPDADPTRTDPGSSRGSQDATTASNEASTTTTDGGGDGDGGYWITGNVVSDDGTPFPGARVELLPNRGPLFTKAALEMIQRATEDSAPIAATRTVGGGSFRIQAPGPGRYDVRTSARGWVGSIDTAQLTPREQEVALWITIYPGLAIAGTLQNAAGSGVAGSTLVLLEKAQDQTRRFHRHVTISDSAGRFRFEGLGLQRYILMAKTASGMTKLVPQVVPPSEQLIVRLDAAVEIQGRVTDSGSEAPIAGALVSGLNPQSWDQAQTDAEGNYTLRLAGADADVLVVHDLYAQSKRRIRLGSDEPNDFSLDPATPFQGRVVLDDGSPAAGATVGFFQSTSWLTDVRTATADSDGRFTIPLAGSGALLARLPGWAPQPPFDAGQGDLVLTRSQTLQGVVLAPDGAAVTGAYLRLHPAPPQSDNFTWVEWLRGVQEGWTDDRGEFAIPDVVPIGSYELEVLHDQFADHRHRIGAVTADPIEVVLANGGTLTLTLVTPDGSRPAGVVVAEFPSGPPVRRRHDATLEGGTMFVIPSDGFVQLGSVPAGDVTLYVRALPFLEERIQVTVAEDELLSREVLLRRGCDVTIELDAPAGKPTAGVLVTLAPESRTRADRAANLRARTGRTAGDGSLELLSVTPGKYRVSARQLVGDTEMLVGSTSIEIGEQEQLRVPLSPSNIISEPIISNEQLSNICPDATIPSGVAKDDLPTAA
ncbi:MAG: carboxypeptidase regulatory-like domain-containing protein, partial [Planctomycetota bacterium]